MDEVLEKERQPFDAVAKTQYTSLRDPLPRSVPLVYVTRIHFDNVQLEQLSASGASITTDSGS